MTTVLDVVGLAALTAAGFAVTLALGLALLGAGCLLLSWKITRITAARLARAS